MQTNRVKEMGKKLSNWSRWGADDQIGAVNYITSEKIVRACALVRRGQVFSLAIPFGRRGVQGPDGWRLNPILLMHKDGSDDAAGSQRPEYGSVSVADDLVIMSLQSATHWDALSHVFADGKMYNGFPSSLVTSSGASKDSIEHMRNRLVSRGILFDIARYKGVDALKQRQLITTEDLEGCAQFEHITVEAGDILLIRSGYMTAFYTAKRWMGYERANASPGLSWQTAPWFHEKQIAAVATDMITLELLNEIPDEVIPLHYILMRDMGVTIGEMFYLDELAADCAEDHVYEFFFVAQPLPFEKAVSSPVNPLAIK